VPDTCSYNVTHHVADAVSIHIPDCGSYRFTDSVAHCVAYNITYH
jgi:hypothetical protein